MLAIAGFFPYGSCIRMLLHFYSCPIINMLSSILVLFGDAVMTLFFNLQLLLQHSPSSIYPAFVTSISKLCTNLIKILNLNKNKNKKIK
jgi:hypothetical protein